ncbi:MAG: SH3 domain-containing protein [Blautia sp.]|nr:SH3 domain-containing protein [Blautia sp.]MCM1201020.1 SH3 domain-containing protein [Bacteroides fragilis]
MEKKWKHNKSSLARGVLVTACAVLFFLNGQFTSQAAGTGKIKVGSAIIRQSADKNSEPVATSSQGTVVTINNEVTDSAGSVWYEIQVDANTIGYVRSDLVEKDGGSDTAPDAAQQTNSAGFAPGAEVGPEAPLDAQYATIKVRAAKIRTAASTSKGVVDSLPDGSQVVISGQTTGSDKLWYYVTFTGTDGTEKSGYVRSDLVTLGDMVPVQEPAEQPTEDPQEPEQEPQEPEVKDEYELVYQPDSEGNYEWYLLDRTGEQVTQQKLGEILEAVHALDVNQSIDAKTVAKQRIIIIALIAVIVLLAVIITVMVFKLRDASYEDDDEDDEDDEEEDDRRRGREEPSRRRREERDDPAAARKRPAEQGKQGGARRTDARRPEEAGRPSEARRSQGAGRSGDARRSSEARRTPDGRRPVPEREVRYEEDVDVQVRTGTKRKAKNFMMDDDEFEFEFLNMKDKDRDM